MSELTTDQKIDQLVRSVLAAVDARLSEVRGEMHTLSADVERQHHAVLVHLQELEGRLEHGTTDAAPSGGDPLAARMEQATQVLLERIEAMHQRNTIATNERFASMSAALDQLRGTATSNVTSAPLLPGLEEMNAPLRMPTPAAATTGQVPVLAALTGQAAAPTATPAPAGSEPIDLGKLADLLSERLGHLSLPPRQS